MTAADLVNLPGLMDDAKCFASVRWQRWPEGRSRTEARRRPLTRRFFGSLTPHAGPS
jgi:hypothetical protein